MKYKKIPAKVICFMLFMIVSCAHIPKESIQLSEMVGKRINEQHRAYSNLLNEYFATKRKAIDDFVLSAYTPELMSRIRNKMKVDGVSEIPDSVTQKIIKIIIAKRDSMQSSLEQVRVSILTNTEENMMLLSNANAAITALLNSAVAVEKTTAKALQSVDSITGSKFKFAEFEKTFDQFLIDVGKGSVQANGLYDKVKQISNGEK